MRKLYGIGLAAAMVVGLLAVGAQARTIVRDGSDYDGYANPGGCEVFVHDDRPTQLHVDCRRADAAARIRYRYLRGVGEFAPADVSADIKVNGGDCTRSDVTWRVPVPRTVRVRVPAGCYVHIRSVTFDQGGS